MCLLYNALKLQQEAISKRNNVSFPELLGCGKFAESKVLLLRVVVVLHFNTQHMNCQGTRFSLLRLGQIKALHYFFKIATLRYIKIFKALFFPTQFRARMQFTSMICATYGL